MGIAGIPADLRAVGTVGTDSVCAFSAASGGMDKFRGAARLEAALVKAGAQTLCAMGMAEVEVREVDESVLPWCRSLASALVYTRQARGQA